MRSLLLALALVSSHGAPDETRPGRHPVDGPDVDVRVQIQDRAVRFQIIMNLAYVDEIVDTPREDDYSIKPSEHEGIRETLFEFLRESNSISIDGVKVTPIDKGFVVDEGDMDMLPLFPREMEKALVRVQMSMEYPCKSPPSRVSITWGKFPDNPVLETPGNKPKIEIQAHLIAKGIDAIVPLTIDEPEYTWHDTGESVEDRFLAVPEPPKKNPFQLSLVTGGLVLLVFLVTVVVLGTGLTAARRPRLAKRAAQVSILLVVTLPIAFVSRNVWVVDIPNPFDSTASLPTNEQAATIFTPLHSNIYRAFDYVEESEIYDALARSVKGNLLDDLYNQVYRSLIMHEEGGAVSRVKAVRPVSTVVESVGMLPTHGDRPGFQVLAKWQVDGVVRHWNHAHYRTNEYEARYTVVQEDVGWRIADHQVLGQKRIDEGEDVPTDINPGKDK
jgi:hypothetical protein